MHIVASWVFRYLWFRFKQLTALIVYPMVYISAVWSGAGYFDWSTSAIIALSAFWLLPFCVWGIPILKADPPESDLEWLFVAGSPHSKAVARQRLAERA